MIRSPDDKAPDADADLALSVCELATAMFDAPGAALSLREGGALARAAATGPARDLPAACAFWDRDLSEGGLIVPDASRDPRFFLDPVALAAPGARFYADAPLMADGRVIGLLSILDPAPRHDFDARRQALLARLAELAAGVMTLARDATRQSGLNASLREALKAQTARLDRAARAAAFGYWTLDLTTRALHWSDGLYAIYGLDAASFAPSLSGHLDIYGEAAQTVLAHLQAAVATGRDFDFTAAITRRSDHTPRRLRVQGGIERGADGRPARLCAVVCDVSDRAAPPVEAPRGEALTRLTQELRHPLRDILDVARHAGDDIAAFSESLRADAEALDRLAPEADAAPPVAVGEILRAAVAPFVERARVQDTRLNLHFVDWTHPQGRLDAARLEQALHHVLSQACRTTRGGVISVTASQVQAESDSGALETRLHVSVRDSGPGMSDAAAQALLSGAKGDLGLSIARALVEMMDGRIGVYATPGEGMQVWFEIPVRWASAPAPRPRHLAPDPLRPAASRDKGPAYAPRAAAAPMDAQRLNRDYLRALLQDMKLNLAPTTQS